MSDFKAKYQALQILQRLASGEKIPDKGRGPRLSPQKPGIQKSNDILKEKYSELAELVALHRLEKQAVSALQKMYVSPPKRERRSRRRKKDGEKRKSTREDGEKYELKKQRPLSASSSSSYSSVKSHSSSASFASRTSSVSSSSSVSNSSRTSFSSSNSRSSSKSNSSRSSTKSRSSSNPKPVERHFVTIVEEEEEEEVINQDAIEERQIVQFDEELAQENEEEARRKKEASKRTRQVSFLLETQEESSDDEDDEEEQHEDVFDEEERFVPGEESSFSSHQQRNGGEHDDARDPTTHYIEIENSLLREILSPRSPRCGLKLSPRSRERSPARGRSKSPNRKQRSPSPKRAWEVLNTVPLPPRPVKDIKPCDHKLSNTDNPEIKRWLRHKNALIRRERKAELKKEREERKTAELANQKREDRLAESGEYYDTWVKQKKRDLRRLRREERLRAKEEKRRLEEEKAKREELFQEKQRLSISSFGERVPSPRKEKNRLKKSEKVGGEENVSNLKRRNENEKNKGDDFLRERSFPSSNPFKGVTYDEWMRQKMKQDDMNKRKERQKQKVDPDFKNIIPDLAKERIERAKSGKGKRVNSGLQKEKDERPECDRASSEKADLPKPYTWSTGETSASTQKHPQNSSGPQDRAGLQRPSSARNRIRNVPRQQKAPSSSSGKMQHPGVFSPSFARPEPQGSESNDDHSEHSANIHKGKTSQGKKESSNVKGRNESGDELIWDKALVERNNSHPVADPEDLSIFLTEFDG